MDTDKDDPLLLIGNWLKAQGCATKVQQGQKENVVTVGLL
jgi:hypothetical protein